MYKCYQGNIVSGTESFSIPWIIGENLLQLGMWTLAGYLLWPVVSVSGWPLLTILWAVLVVVVQVLLKKHNCSGCFYYDKLCHLGWGKISSALFKQDSGDPKVGSKLSLFYIVPPPIILVTSIIFAAVGEVVWIYWASLALYLVLNIATFPLRKKSCGLCVMRQVCFGSAVKQNIG